MDKKGIEWGLTTIMIAILLIFLLGVLLFIIGREIRSFVAELSSCDSHGGECMAFCGEATTEYIAAGVCSTASAPNTKCCVPLKKSCVRTVKGECQDAPCDANELQVVGTDCPEKKVCCMVQGGAGQTPATTPAAPKSTKCADQKSTSGKSGSCSSICAPADEQEVQASDCSAQKCCVPTD